MIKFFRKNYILFLFAIIPFGYLFSYLLEKLGASSISSYFFLVSIILILHSNKARHKYFLAIFLFLYLIFNLIFFGGKLTSNAREITPFILFLATVYSARDLIKQLSLVSQKDLYIFFKYFTFLFVACFLITASIEGKAIYVNIEESERFYYNGFVISHQFSYFSILLAFIFLKFRKYLWFFSLCILALLVGNRISYLALLATFFIFLEGNKNVLISITVRRISFIVLASFIIFILYFTFIESVLSWDKISKILLNQDYRDFTSGRSLFWYNGLKEVVKDPIFSFNFLCGRGPDSVEILASRLYGQYYWMHNDFMQVYFCYGLIGILLYVHGLYYFSKISKSASIFWFVLITAILNGFYTYGALQLIIMLLIILKLKTFHPSNHKTSV